MAQSRATGRYPRALPEIFSSSGRPHLQGPVPHHRWGFAPTQCTRTQQNLVSAVGPRAADSSRRQVAIDGLVMFGVCQASLFLWFFFSGTRCLPVGSKESSCCRLLNFAPCPSEHLSQPSPTDDARGLEKRVPLRPSFPTPLPSSRFTYYL